jgi:hypothetical protein
MLPTGSYPKNILLFAVGYTGWRNLQTVKGGKKESVVDGILVIDSGLFAATAEALDVESDRPAETNDYYCVISAKDDWALWGLLCCLHQLIHGMRDDCSEFLAYTSRDAIEINPRLAHSQTRVPVAGRGGAGRWRPAADRLAALATGADRGQRAPHPAGHGPGGGRGPAGRASGGGEHAAAGFSPRATCSNGCGKSWPASLREGLRLPPSASAYPCEHD